MRSFSGSKRSTQCYYSKCTAQSGSFFRNEDCRVSMSVVDALTSRSASLTRKSSEIANNRPFDEASCHHRRPDPLHCVAKKYSASSSSSLALEGLQPLHTLARGSHSARKTSHLGSFSSKEEKKKFFNVVFHPWRISRRFLSFFFRRDTRKRSKLWVRGYFFSSSLVGCILCKGIDNRRWHNGVSIRRVIRCNREALLSVKIPLFFFCRTNLVDIVLNHTRLLNRNSSVRLGRWFLINQFWIIFTHMMIFKVVRISYILKDYRDYMFIFLWIRLKKLGFEYGFVSSIKRNYWSDYLR